MIAVIEVSNASTAQYTLHVERDHHSLTPGSN